MRWSRKGALPILGGFAVLLFPWTAFLALTLPEPPSHTALEFRVGGIQLDDGRRSAMDRVLNRASLDQLFRSAAAPNDWKKQQGLIVTADRPEC